MIYDHLKRPVNSFAYFRASKERVIIQRIYAALDDGSYKLVWVRNGTAGYIFVTPSVVWVGSQSIVDANVEWEIV